MTAVAYDQAKPTEEAVLDSLAELVGPDGAQTVWESTCARAEIHPPVSDLSALLLVAEMLTSSEVSLARVAGRSIVIRISSYSALNEQGLG